jgi:DNA-binding GntR family transcriptional regulator
MNWPRRGSWSPARMSGRRSATCEKRGSRWRWAACRTSTGRFTAWWLMHSRLLAALEARDAEAAAEMMRAHYRELDLNFADVIFGEASG